MIRISTGPRQNVWSQQLLHWEPTEALEALELIGSVFQRRHWNGLKDPANESCSWLRTTRQHTWQAAPAQNPAEVVGPEDKLDSFTEAALNVCHSKRWCTETSLHTSWVTRFDLILSAQMRWFVQMSLTDWVLPSDERKWGSHRCIPYWFAGMSWSWWPDVSLIGEVLTASWFRRVWGRLWGKASRKAARFWNGSSRAGS